MRSKTRFVVKYVSFAELNEKKKKIVKKVANIERWFYHYVSEDRKTMEMADERFFFFLNEFVFRFFSAMYSFHFFLSAFLYIYIYHVGQNFKHEGERNEAIVVWVFKDVTPAKMSIIDVRNDTGVDDKWHQRRLFRSFELLTSAAFMHGKKC